MIIGKNFSRLRHQKGLTQEQLSVLTDISQQYLSDLERGKRNPTVSTLMKIADALDSDLVTLVTALSENSR